MIARAWHWRAVAALTSVGWLVGCAVTPSECDPRVGDPSLYVKARCLYSGEYRQREEQKRALLEEELRLKALFEETYAALQAEQVKLNDDTANSHTVLTAVSQSVATLHDALQTRAQNDKQLKKKISELRVEAEKIEQQPGQSPVQQRQALSDLMVKVSDLQKTLELR